ncbi:hypothetical protein P12x_002783 [Tundrisphaera lichenicola]|uniref:hypothetical protein n=1 Tax=Tundrisphaera lichenicola TaxID=2029860 RepID=UPI003EBB63DB
MRFAIALLCGLFATATLVGCGGATIPEPPANAKAGPPPGTSDDMVKVKEKEKPKRR